MAKNLKVNVLRVSAPEKRPFFFFYTGTKAKEWEGKKKARRAKKHLCRLNKVMQSRVESARVTCGKITNYA